MWMFHYRFEDPGPIRLPGLPRKTKPSIIMGMGRVKSACGVKKMPQIHQFGGFS